MSIPWLVRVKRFRVDVTVEGLHVIYMNLNSCRVFRKIKHTSEHNSNTLKMGSSSHSQTQKYVPPPAQEY